MNLVPAKAGIHNACPFIIDIQPSSTTQVPSTISLSGSPLHSPRLTIVRYSIATIAGLAYQLCCAIASAIEETGLSPLGSIHPTSGAPPDDD